jgi:hypothetical protein
MIVFILSGMITVKTPLKNAHRGLEPGDHLAPGLAVGRVEEHLPRVDRGEDQAVGDLPGPAGRVGDQSEPAEVDLQLHTRVAVGDQP